MINKRKLIIDARLYLIKDEAKINDYESSDIELAMFDTEEEKIEQHLISKIKKMRRSKNFKGISSDIALNHIDYSIGTLYPENSNNRCIKKMLKYKKSSSKSKNNIAVEISFKKIRENVFCQETYNDHKLINRRYYEYIEKVKY